jgi:hypothetical protein
MSRVVANAIVLTAGLRLSASNANRQSAASLLNSYRLALAILSTRTGCFERTCYLAGAHVAPSEILRPDAEWDTIGCR